MFIPTDFVRRGGRTISAMLLAWISGASVLLSQQTYTQGFLNLPQTAEPGTLLSHPNANDSVDIGRTTTVNYLRGWLIVGGEGPGSRPNSDLRVRVYDISNPEEPVRKLPSNFGLSYANDVWYSGNYGFNAHGTAIAGNYLYAQSMRVEHFGGVVDKGGAFSTLHPTLTAGRASMQGSWGASFPWYGSADADFKIRKRFRTGPTQITRELASFNHVGPYGGGDWHPMFFGDLLIYARSGSSGNDGVVVYRLQYHDFDTPATATVTPQLIGTLQGGFRAYWPVLFSDGEGLYVVGSETNVLMAADISQAADPAGDGSVTLTRSMTVPGFTNASYPVFQDQYAFIHNRKVNMTQFLAGNPNPITLTLDEMAAGVDTSQISRPLGNLWLTGGYQKSGRSQGMAVWVQQKAPDIAKPEIAFHIPQSGRTNYPRHAPLSFLLHETPRNGGVRNGVDFTVRPVLAGNDLGTPVGGYLIHDMSGVLTFNQDAGLAADTTYQVDFLSDPANGIGFQDAAGNWMDAYSFRFSTGGGVNASAPPVVSIGSDTYHPAPGGNFVLTASATGGGPFEYRFNFDGTWSGWSGTASASHAYAEEGRFRVLVQVKDANGNIVTESVRILATSPLPVSPPTKSGALALGEGGKVWVVNPDSATVSAIQSSNGSKLGEYEVGAKPRNVARDGNGRLWVTCEGSDEIHILDENGSTYQVVSTGYGMGPFGIAANPAGDAMFVSYQSAGKMARFSVANPSAAPVTATTFPTPRAIAISGDGQRIFVTRFISDEGIGQIGEFEPTLAVAMKTATLRYAATTDGGDRAAGVPNYLTEIAISPDGRRAAIVSKQDNTLRGQLYGVGDLTPETTTRAVVSFVSLIEGGTGNVATELYGYRKDFDNSDSPSSLTFSPHGDMLFVTLQGNNKMVGLDMMALTPLSGSGTADTISSPATISAEVATGAAPQGVILDPVSKKIFVQNFMDRSVTVLGAGDYLEKNQMFLPPVTTTVTVANETLAPQVLAGKKIFYHASERMSQDGYISCATCHLDGGHDGRVWDFTGRGEGLRRTTDLRGKSGTRHGNVHWSGNFDEIQDFEHDIRGPFGGLGFLDLAAGDFQTQHPSPASQKSGLSVDLDALAAYVESLGEESVPRSPFREADGSLTAAAVRGRQVFESLNCASCHSGPEYTESALSNVNSALLRDVGTIIGASGERLGQGDLTGVDTPTLIGLHATQTYLHHGMTKSFDRFFRYAGGTTYHAGDGEYIMTEGSTGVRNVVTTTLGGGGDGRGYFNGDYLNIQGSSGFGVRFNQVEGGAGGTARLAFRYAMRYGNSNVTLKVNGVSQTLAWLQQYPGNGYRTTGWRWHEVEVTLNPGTANTIEVLRTTRELGLDVMIVSTSEDLAKAAVHRFVSVLPQADQDDLIAYLKQIDGRDDLGRLDVPPVIVSSPASQTVQEGSNVTFSVAATGTPPPTYQWKHGGVNVGTNSPTLMLQSATPAASGSYSVVVTNSAGSITSAAANLVVRPNFVALDSGYSTAVEANFSGTNPSMSLPWSSATVAPGIVYGGWSKGAGISAATGNDELLFHQSHPATEAASTLMNSISANAYWSTTIAPSAGVIDLRAASVQFGIRRIDEGAPRRFAVFTSVGGFAAGQEIYDTGRFNDTIPRMFRLRLPVTAAYRNVSGPVEIRIVGYSGQGATQRAALFAFRMDRVEPGSLILTGTSNREYWTGITGTTVASLTGHASFPDSPSGQDQVGNGLEAVGWAGSQSPGAPTNYGNTYGQRLRAFLVPEVSGTYTFWISGDDGVELWLSATANPVDRVRIAHHNSFSSYRQWNKLGSQKSAPIALLADTSYYIEVLHKEQGSSDHVSVGWAKPGEATTAPSEIVPARVLSAFSEGDPVAAHNASAGLVAHWRFDQNLVDSAPEGSSADDGTAVGSPAYLDSTAAAVGAGALSLDGSSQHVMVGTSSDLAIASPMTISAWIKIQSSTDNSHRMIVSKKTSFDDPTGYELFYHPSLNRLFFRSGGKSIPYSFELSGLDLDTGWHHIAVTVNGSVGMFYVDGTRITSNISGVVGNPLAGSTSLVIGRRSGNSQYTWNGAIDDVRIYNRNLPDEEIGQIYLQR